jgi:predicted transcriptional regulator
MGQATVRISERTRERLREMARAQHDSMQSVLEKAVEEYRRKSFFEQLDAAYAKLQEDPEAWEAYQAELKVWEATLADGLPEGENWGEDGAPEPESKRKSKSRAR